MPGYRTAPSPLRLPALAAALALCAPTALALQPLPSQKIPDTDAARVLSQAYGERVRLDGRSWRGMESAGGRNTSVRRKVCADSGPEQRGARDIAVCSTGAGGSVDVWILSDARSEQQQVRVWSSKRGIATPLAGQAGVVELREWGPGRAAFLIQGAAPQRNPQANLAVWMSEYHEFEPVLSIGTRVQSADTDLRCVLRIDHSQYDYARYGQILDVIGREGAHPVGRNIKIPHKDGRFVISEQVLQQQGCDRP
ncbi:hypothetical protein [Pseudomonas sp. CGJS7]|uniref:hypothetical protein n=1 Tax=Pseudomonas sp. CGJS7 TaxID=3109348 RepID=UPI0030091D48